MNNKLDSFNNDKTKCEKCKEYFDKDGWGKYGIREFCEKCTERWETMLADKSINILELGKLYNELINEQ